MLNNLKGALYGVAIGDGMGAPVEGWSPEDIIENFSDVKDFLPCTHNDDPEKGKGYGRITDDTLMTEALIRAYLNKKDHMDAHDYKEYFLPEIIDNKVWIPEYQKEMPIYERLWWPEKYPRQRLMINNKDPRSAGIGNMVNCGIAMYMMPVGAVNAGDPESAYQEAASFGLAHNESFAVEAAAVMAASYAKAFDKKGTIECVIKTAQNRAKYGTKDAISDTEAVVKTNDSLKDFIFKVRKAVKPYDQRKDHYSDKPLSVGVGDVGQPSNIHSIEELPAALAALKYGDGDFFRTLKAAVFYGRDCDSIASMAIGLYGAVFGYKKLSKKLCNDSDAANKRDYDNSASRFMKTIKQIFEKDSNRFICKQKTIKNE